MIDRNGRQYEDSKLQASREVGALRNSKSRARALEFLSNQGPSKMDVLDTVSSQSVLGKLRKEGLVSLSKGVWNITPEGVDWLMEWRKSKDQQGPPQHDRE